MTWRLILGFVLLCAIEVLFVGWLVHRSTQQSFGRLVREESAASFRSSATAYFEKFGTWEGFAEELGSEQAARGAPAPGGAPQGGRAPSGAPRGGVEGGGPPSPFGGPPGPPPSGD